MKITDPDCVNFRNRQGSHAGYNAQIVVDDAHEMIVSSDVVSIMVGRVTERSDNPRLG